jgi:hypothetical protein
VALSNYKGAHFGGYEKVFTVKMQVMAENREIFGSFSWSKL